MAEYQRLAWVILPSPRRRFAQWIGAARTYVFTLSRDAEGTDVVETSLPIPDGTAETRWRPLASLEGGKT